MPGTGLEGTPKTEANWLACDDLRTLFRWLCRNGAVGRHRLGLLFVACCDLVISVNPAWLTSDVVALARQMYVSRDFSAMPILADALQDAGCENEDVLAHCRGVQQVHVRGCWVADLLPGKE